MIMAILGCSLLSGNTYGEGRVTAQLSQYGDDWVATVYGAVDITKQLAINIEVDSTGYLALGAGYGWLFERSYAEVFGNYGRGDFFDLIDAGVFGVGVVSSNVSLYGMTGLQWRKSNAFPILGVTVFDDREWKNTVGIMWSPIKLIDVDLSASADVLVSGGEGLAAVENRDLLYQSLSISFKPKWVEPFIRITNGKHRVRPGDPIPTYNSLEFGARIRY
jgi:hypothetical protein